MEENTLRTILHIDGDAFFASVEETLFPALKKVPMAICGDPESRRGVILAKNQLASQYDIKTAETVWQARKKCPDLVLAPSRHGLYQEFCEKLNTIYQQYTDRVERLSIDESYLDVTGSLHLFRTDGMGLAEEIRQRVEQEVGVTVSIGVSYNKIFAKMASDLNKPNGSFEITPRNFRQTLWPMPIEKLYMVGKVTGEKLRSLGIRTIGELAVADPELLTDALGKAGEQLHRNANGGDKSPVTYTNAPEEIKSVGNGRTFRRNLNTLADIQVGVTALSDLVASRLRRKNIKCTTVQVMIKDPAFKVITRQMTVEPTWLAADLIEASLELIQQSWPKGSPIRMLTITGSNLVPAEQATHQLSLFLKPEDKERHAKREKLEHTMDAIREKYGTASISSGNVVNNDLGLRDGNKSEELEELEETEEYIE